MVSIIGKISILFLMINFSHASTLSFSYTAGQNNLKGYGVSFFWDNKSILFTKSNDDFLDLFSLTYGFDKEVSKYSSLDFSIGVLKENDIKGIAPAIEYSVEQNWTDETASVFWLGAEHIIFFEESTETSSSGKNKKEVQTSLVNIDSFSQTILSLGIDHYFNDFLSIGAYYSAYSYSNSESDKLDDGLSSLDSVSSNINSSWSTYGAMDVAEKVKVEISYSKAFSNDISNISITKRAKLSYDFNLDFSVNAGLSITDKNDIEDKIVRLGIKLII